MSSSVPSSDPQNIVHLPGRFTFPGTHVPLDKYKEANTPILIDNGSSTFRFGYAGQPLPRTSANAVAKYKERKFGKQLLLFGDDIESESGARGQAKTPWEGDVLLNFDALVSFAHRLVRYDV